MPEPLPETVEALFHAAADLAPEQRPAFLDEQCHGDAALRAAVEELLRHDDGDTDGFLSSPLAPLRASLDPAPALKPPGPVGHYRLLRPIGEGGMGIVYEAEQGNPRRRVALKVIRPDLVVPDLFKRFTHEAQLLGRLHHPGIAQIYEAGLAEDGRPFFAMEFIEGLPLDTHVRLRGLTVPARLELLARVCDAVQHDHGVIHRDLKPGNILVDETGQPKVLDFGIARATDADLQTTSGRTQAGQLIGTLSYMSPEQVAGDPTALDQRSDVYALGVILFELLVERLPYQLEHLPLWEVAQIICEQEPPRLGSINAAFRGDIETIVGKALAKDKARRYASAGELAADIRRYLAHEPIRARPPSVLYQLRKFTRRHKALVGGVVATVTALVLGLVGTTLFAVGEARQRRQADDEKREAQFQAYRAHLAAAVAALSAHDVVDAARQLKAAPDNLRGWEWWHLRSRLDDSSAEFPLPAQAGGFLLGAPDRLQVVAMTDTGLSVSDLEGGESRILPIGPEHGHHVTVAQTRRGLRVAAWVGKTSFDLLDEAGRVLCRAEIPDAIDFAPVVVSPDGKRLACAAWFDGGWTRLGVFDATSGQRTALCAGHRDNTWAYTFSPDGTRLASGGEDNAVRLWDPATGALRVTCQGHTSKVLGVAFSPDGKRLVTTSADSTVRQWDPATGQEIEAPYDRHSGEVLVAAYSPDGNWVASAGSDRTVRVWRAKGRQDIAVLHGHMAVVTAVAFAAGGRRLASLSGTTGIGWTGDDTVRVWEVDLPARGTDLKSVLQGLPVLRGHTSYVYPVAFSPDGRWIASGGWDKPVPAEEDCRSLRLWDAATGEPCAILPHPGIVRILAFGPDSRWLVSAGDGDDRLRLWDVATARVRKEIRGPGPSVRGVAVSPDGRRVAAHAWDDQQRKHLLSVYDVISGEPLFAADGRVLAYSPDGRWLATVDADDQTVLLLDARTHETAARFRGHEQLVSAAAFSSDSRRLATCSHDRTVCLWDVSQGSDRAAGVTECQVLRGHTEEVFAAVFHPDGTRLATAGRDRAIWLWDLARGEEVARLPGHTSYVWSLAFSPDGTTLVSGSGDQTVRLWDTAPLTTRYQARRDAAALQPEAQRLVEQLWRQMSDSAAVVEVLRMDPTLSEPLRHAALRLVMSGATGR